MSTQTQKLTYEEYLKTPEIKARYDIVDGVMIMAPSPTLRHQTILRQLFLLLNRFVAEHQLGEVWFAPLDILVQRAPLRTTQPDLLFVSNERSEILGDIIEGAPDLVVEILSPNNSRADIQAKLGDYAGLGVRECWLVSPEARSVEVLGLSEGNLARVAMYGSGDLVSSSVLPELPVAVNELFG